MSRYVLASRLAAPIEAMRRRRADLPGQWTIVTAKQDLTLDMLEALKPRYVFFPHWSWIVPPPILAAFECVCFHMTDVPFGRGGSPLQNLIAAGHKETMLTALRMEKELDAGPVYAKRPLSLSGSAQDILARAAGTAQELMAWIVENEPAPRPQTGAPTTFARRTPAESALPAAGSLERLYDHVRMLDADGYPQAFIETGDWRIEFSDARLDGGALEMRARLTVRNSGGPRT
jgi:methionyl-tRNA formyltransferase